MKILKFGAIWCPGCLSMSKTWNDIITNYELDIDDYDIDMDEEFCDEYKIGDILPVYIFLNSKGEEIDRLIGEQKKETLIQKIEKYRNE